MSGTRQTDGGAPIRGNASGQGPILVHAAPPVVVSIDHGSIPAGTNVEATATVQGLTTADSILAMVQAALQDGLSIAGARVTAADTVGVTLHNSTASPIDPAALNWLIWPLRTQVQF